MSSIVISGDTSGAITLAAPAVSGTNTATLPAATGTVMVSGNMPAFSAYASGGQSVPNATQTKIQFNNENFDTNNNFDSATNYRFTPTVAGYYQLNAVVSFNGGVSAFSAVITLYKNGSSYMSGSLATPVSVSIGAASNVSSLVYFNGSTDYAEIYVYQTSGISLGLQAGNAVCQFSGSLVRAA